MVDRPRADGQAAGGQIVLQGLPPVLAGHPTILILGSMPSVASLQQQQYYGHPRNAFWPMLARINEFPEQQEYANNVIAAIDRGIAIWDVIGECVRPGSLDSAIVKGSERINDIPGLLRAHPQIKRIGLNGGTAANLFKRHCMGHFIAEHYQIFKLPSTSPANAAMSFEQKCQHWQALFD